MCVLLALSSILAFVEGMIVWVLYQTYTTDIKTFVAMIFGFLLIGFVSIPVWAITIEHIVITIKTGRSSFG